MARKTEKITAANSAPPKFGNEREEAEWWANNPDFILAQFERAKAEGRLGHGTVKRLYEERQIAKSTTIRLDPRDIELAKEQADSKGLRYQTYLKMLIHEALDKEAAKATR